MKNSNLKPFIGARPFSTSAEDQQRFSGRFFETERIVSYIYSHPVTLIYAPSGAGKTSLINAGVIPVIKQKKFVTYPPSRIQNIVSSKKIPKIKNQYIFNLLFRISGTENPEDVSNETLLSFLKKQPRDKNTEEHPKLIIIDQFEEFFNIPVENWKRQQDNFFEQIKEAINSDPLLRIVFLIREEYVGKIEKFGTFLPEEFRIRFRLGPLSRNDAIAALTNPILNNTPIKFSDGVAEKIVNDMSMVKVITDDREIKETHGDSIEPVHLQLVGVTLWMNLPDNVTSIEMKHVKEYGDVNTILRNYYEESIHKIATSFNIKQKELRDWFNSSLITPTGTRNIVFRGKETTQGLKNNIVNEISDQHIIRGEDRAGGRWFELTHDRWIQPIKNSNAEWNRNRAKTIQKRIVTGLVSLIIFGSTFTFYKYKNLNLNKSIVPFVKQNPVTQLTPISYNKFKILKDIRVLDFRSWKKMPFWHEKICSPSRPVLCGPYSPVTWMRYTLAQKQDANYNTLVFRYATSGYLAPRSITHDFNLDYCPDCQLHPTKKTREAWNINVNVENEQIGHEFLVVTEATYWNAFQGDDENKEWASISVTDKETVMIGVSLIFPDDMKYKDLNLYKTHTITKEKTVLVLPENGKKTKDKNSKSVYKLFVDNDKRTVFWFINNPNGDYRYDVAWTWIERE